MLASLAGVFANTLNLANEGPSVTFLFNRALLHFNSKLHLERIVESCMISVNAADSSSEL